VDSQGRTIWIADAHRGDGKRFVVRADEKLTAFLELESAIGGFAPRRAELHRFAAENPKTVENDRRKCVRLWNTSQSG
jgi:hypothetical protein